MVESPLSPLENIEKKKKKKTLITIVICKFRRLGGARTASFGIIIEHQMSKLGMKILQNEIP
jgi:hypothetical protein